MLRATAVVAALLLALYELTSDRSFASGQSAAAYLRANSTGRIIIALAAGALVVLKPRLERAESMLFGGLMGLALDLEYDHFPGVAFWAACVLANVAIGTAVALLTRYALSYLPASVFVCRASLVAIVAGGLLAIAGFVPPYVYYCTSLSQSELWSAVIAPDLNRVRWGILLAACVCIEGAALLAWIRVASEHRRRMLVVVIGFAPLVLGTGFHSASIVLGHPVAEFADIDAAGTVLSAILLAASLLSGQLVAVEYFALITLAATLTGLLVASLAFAAEHFLTEPIAHFFEALPALARFNKEVHEAVQIGIAFCVFLLISRAHEAITEFVRDLIFAHRTEHLEALRTLAEDVGEGSRAEIASRLVAAAVEHTGASNAALYLREGKAFRPIASTDPAPLHALAEGDVRIPPLRRPLTPDDGSLTLPMPIGPHLTGFLHCQPKRRMTDYAPDEIEALALATRETGIALCVELPVTRVNGIV